MSSFKNHLKSDLGVFLNSDEFAEPHVINNRTLNIVVDNDRLIERSKKEFDGISVGELLYYVSADIYGPMPSQGEIQLFDRKVMQVFDVRSDNGLYEIILHRNTGE
jgi:hypothetical protein